VNIKVYKAYRGLIKMGYKLMRLRKYYDIVRTNNSFFSASLSQKAKILLNILRFWRNNITKPLIINNKPVVAQIEPTSTCNLKCAMCIRDKIGVPIGTMSFENFKKILIKLNCLFKIHLSGQGESFLNKDLFKMIAYANSKGIIVNLNTNATLLNKEAIEKICRANIGEIAISIESTNKKEYESIRKGAKFDLVMNNLKELSSALRKNNKNTILSFAVTILKENTEELPRFVLFADKVGIKKIIAQTIQEKDDYIKNYSSEAKGNLIISYKKRLNGLITQSKTIAKRKGIEFIFDEEKSSGCIWPWRSIYVTWNGNVTPCCKILDYRKVEAGNLLTDDFWKVWNGKTYQMYRKMLKRRIAPLPCKGCNRV
jgi:radical SAM protein with 4Fe4S-binding SPASM domain